MRASPRRAPVSQTGNAVHPDASPHSVFSAAVAMTLSKFRVDPHFSHKDTFAGLIMS